MVSKRERDRIMWTSVRIAATGYTLSQHQSISLGWFYFLFSFSAPPVYILISNSLEINSLHFGTLRNAWHRSWLSQRVCSIVFNVRFLFHIWPSHFGTRTHMQAHTDRHTLWDVRQYDDIITGKRKRVHDFFFLLLCFLFILVVLICLTFWHTHTCTGIYMYTIVTGLWREIHTRCSVEFACYYFSLFSLGARQPYWNLGSSSSAVCGFFFILSIQFESTNG